MFNIKLGSHVRIFVLAVHLVYIIGVSLVKQLAWQHQHRRHSFLCILDPRCWISLECWVLDTLCYTPGWWFQPTHLKNHGVRQLGLG